MHMIVYSIFFFFFQAEDGIRDVAVTGVQTCALPISIEIAGKEVSADALLTQRELADYLVTKRKAHYHFTVKGNQPGVLEDLKLYFQDRGEAHFVEHTPPDHGRVETRKIWTTTELNDYLNFPHVAQAFVIERHVTRNVRLVFDYLRMTENSCASHSG